MKEGLITMALCLLTLAFFATVTGAYQAIFTLVGIPQSDIPLLMVVTFVILAGAFVAAIKIMDRRGG